MIRHKTLYLSAMAFALGCALLGQTIAHTLALQQPKPPAHFIVIGWSHNHSTTHSGISCRHCG